MIGSYIGSYDRNDYNYNNLGNQNPLRNSYEYASPRIDLYNKSQYPRGHSDLFDSKNSLFPTRMSNPLASLSQPPHQIGNGGMRNYYPNKFQTQRNFLSPSPLAVNFSTTTRDFPGSTFPGFQKYSSSNPLLTSNKYMRNPLLSPIMGPNENERIQYEKEPASVPSGMTGGMPDSPQKFYSKQLESQIYEKRMREENSRKMDFMKEREEIEYNPFGKSGSGAPMRDREGNIITTRRPYANPKSYQSPMKHESNFRTQPVRKPSFSEFSQTTKPQYLQKYAGTFGSDKSVSLQYPLSYPLENESKDPYYRHAGRMNNHLSTAPPQKERAHTTHPSIQILFPKDHQYKMKEREGRDYYTEDNVSVESHYKKINSTETLFNDKSNNKIAEEDENQNYPNPSMFVTRVIDPQHERQRRKMQENLQNELREQIEQKKRMKEEEKRQRMQLELKEEERIKKERMEINHQYNKEIGIIKDEQPSRTEDRSESPRKDSFISASPVPNHSVQETPQPYTPIMDEEFSNFKKSLDSQKLSKTLYEASLDDELNSLKRQMADQEKKFHDELSNLKVVAKQTVEQNQDAEKQLIQLKEDLSRHNTALSSHVLENLKLAMNVGRKRKYDPSTSTISSQSINTKDFDDKKDLQNYGKLLLKQYNQKKDLPLHKNKIKNYNLDAQSQMVPYIQLPKPKKQIPKSVRSPTQQERGKLMQEFDSEMDKLDQLMLDMIEKDGRQKKPGQKAKVAVFETTQSFGNSQIKPEVKKVSFSIDSYNEDSLPENAVSTVEANTLKTANQQTYDEDSENQIEIKDFNVKVE